MSAGMKRGKNSAVLGVRLSLVFLVLAVFEPAVLFVLRLSNVISDDVMKFVLAAGIFLIFIYVLLVARAATKFRPVFGPIKAQRYFRELGKRKKVLSWVELNDNVVVFILFLALGLNLFLTPLFFQELPYFGLNDGGEGLLVFGYLFLFFSLYSALMLLWMRTFSYIKFVGRNVRFFVLAYFVVVLGVLIWQLNLFTNFFSSFVEVIR